MSPKRILALRLQPPPLLHRRRSLPTGTPERVRGTIASATQMR